MNIIVLGAGSAGLMSAILIKRFYKNSPFDVKIIQSGKAPILGVGEGTTEHVQHFIQHAHMMDAYKKAIQCLICHQQFCFPRFSGNHHFPLGR